MGLALPRDFRELLELLNSHQVRYLLIGGYAVGHYGHSRSTNDIDLFISGDEANSGNLASALEEFGFGDSGLSKDLFMSKNNLVILGVEPMAIDILNYCKGVDFEAAYSRRVVLNDAGLEICIIGYEDLIANKTAVGRHKDLADVEYLQRLRNV